VRMAVHVGDIKLQPILFRNEDFFAESAYRPLSPGASFV
jgi:hypothetical protein